MASFLDLANNVLTHGIDAYAETQRVKYTPNDPTPNNRGTGTITAPAGEPAYGPAAETIAATFSNPLNLVLLAAAAALVVVLVKS